MNTRPIVIVDDDIDDREFLQSAWDELDFPNKLLFFSDGKSVLDYLHNGNNKPFLILCDVNIPKMDGFELKSKLLEEAYINYKSIPFIFWSSAVSQTQIQKAYDLGVNGFFIKESKHEAIKQSLIDIYNYWSKSKTPDL